MLLISQREQEGGRLSPRGQSTGGTSPRLECKEKGLAPKCAAWVSEHVRGGEVRTHVYELSVYACVCAGLIYPIIEGEQLGKD